MGKKNSVEYKTKSKAKEKGRRKLRRRAVCKSAIFLLGLLLWCCFYEKADAQTTQERNITDVTKYPDSEGALPDISRLTEQLDQGQIAMLQEELDRLFPGGGIQFTEALERLIHGDLQGVFESLKTGVWDKLAGEAAGFKKVFFHILMIGILSALFSTLSGIFENHQVSEISFYITYLMLIMLLLKTFEQAAVTMVEMIDNMLLFMKLLIPTYALIVGMASGISTGTLYYQFLLLLIYAVQLGVSVFVLPMVYCYVFLNVVNGLWAEERLGMLAALLHKTVKGLLKITLTAIFGINLIQTMITPVIDSVKNTAARKVITAIPGLGNLAGGVTEMLVGSAVLIKNSMGVLFILILLAVCLIPVLKLFIITVLLKTAAAVMGMVADRRITGCTDRVGEGSALLLQCALTAAAMFIITIAILSYTTNRGF